MLYHQRSTVAEGVGLGVMRFRELDGLRGIAAFAVVVYHLTVGHDAFFPDDPASPVTFHYGEYGVQLFFLISGFVILMTAQRSKRPSDFVISRVSRLYPPYWLAVVVSSVLVLAFGVPVLSGVTWWERLANLTMIQRWFFIPNVDMVYWTLAIEMQFYVLLFVMLVATKCRITPRVVLVVGLLWVAVGLLVALAVGASTRGMAPSSASFSVKVLLNATLAEQAPLFVCGMFAFLAREDRRFRWLSWLMGGAAVLVSGLLKGAEVAAIVTAVVMVFFVVVGRQQTKVLLWQPIQFYGRISYTLYIQHAITGIVLIHLLVPLVGRVVAMIIAAALVTAWAWLAHEIAEVRWSRGFKQALLKLRPMTLD